ncbi:MAG: pyruvate kinase [Thermoleophilia bacterium]|nr:pyruvate kinase [Thermoleophilia bacterium]
MTLLPRHKTRIVCTIGPASQARGTLERMIRNGMNVARLNLAHGDFESRRATIAAIRSAAARVGIGVTLLADLPGPKLRVGRLALDQVELKQGQNVRLLALDEPASTAPDAAARMPTPSVPELPLTLPSFPDALKAGDDIFLNDGLVQLRVLATDKNAGPGHRLARVLVGGVLRSRDGVALPGIDLGTSAFTSRDHELLAFALSEGIEAVGVSFVQRPHDITAVREAAAALGFDPFVVAKIERAQAVERIDAILEVSDAIMVARGDLGVDIPIERITVAQKLLIARANAAGKPVITATQMLESMTKHRRPSRAEVTDVSNAVLDGTDCVMLSEETAVGRYPVEAVKVMSRVADLTERHLPGTHRPPVYATTVRGVLAEEATTTAERLNARYIIVPTETGTAARIIARLRPKAWIVALSPFEETCRRLQFSRGVYPVFVPEAAHVPVSNWHNIARRWFREQKLRPGLAVMVQGNNRLEVIDLATSEQGPVGVAQDTNT